MPKQWNYVGYARVSTGDQDLGLQVRALENFGVPAKQIFSETISTRTRTRPQLEGAFQNLRPGDVFVVWKLDRLGRDVKELLVTLEDLHNRGVELKSLTQSMDTRDSMGRMMFTILAAVAQWERDLTSERTKAGIAEAKARGTWTHRPPVVTPCMWKKAVAKLEKDPEIAVAALASYVGMKKGTAYTYIKRMRNGAPYPWEGYKRPKKRKNK